MNEYTGLLANEHFLHSGMPFELSAFWLVSLVRMFANMWTHRLVCIAISFRLLGKPHKTNHLSCHKLYKVGYRKVSSFLKHATLSCTRISSKETPMIPSPNLFFQPWHEVAEVAPFYIFKGKMIRRRTVTQPFQGDGRPCPSLMEQSKPCPVKPCYRWQYGQWSPCQVQVSNFRKLCECILHLQRRFQVRDGWFPHKHLSDSAISQFFN